ncbi:protein of unknown function [Methylorubrum extorquens]|uniref:Uncharacterized protein n=1 Tax=Methylorubrum extorquens TaxID=408 RepID=A0A2N9AJW5_METEX|nr:protein of unknown function [Methylorubrum extorquens]
MQLSFHTKVQFTSLCTRLPAEQTNIK